MAGLEEYGLLFVGLAVGTLLGWILAKQSTSGDIIRAEERIRASEETASVNEQRIRAEVENISKRISEFQADGCEQTGMNLHHRPKRIYQRIRLAE